MIERHWKGIAKNDKAEEYIDHLKNDTFVQLRAISGFVSARILKRSVTEGTEFLIVTAWKDIQSIKGFAGSNVETAVVPEHVRKVMVRYDEVVQHYEIGFETRTL